MKALTNKKGVSYILTCVIILVCVLVIAVAMQYAYIYHVAREQKNETQLKLDSYITKYSIQYYDAFKQGEAYEKYIDRDDVVDGAYTLLGFPRIINLVYIESPGVEGKYIMERPTIYAMAGDSIGVYVKYDILFPFEMFGYELTQIRVPIEIVSKLTQK